MAESMQFDLVSPEKKLASLKVNMVQIPGSDGDLTAMPNHAPTIASLRPGVLRAVGETGEILEYVVSGGFVEISDAGTSVLAERALLKSEASADFFDAAVAHAQKAVELADNDVSKAVAEMALNDVQFLRSELQA